MRKFFQFILLVLLALTLISCAPAQSSEEIPASETLNYEPDYISAPKYYDQGVCIGTWIENKYIDSEYPMDNMNPKYTGLYATQKQVGDIQKNLELKTATTIWLITLDYVRINDRVVYPDSWTVVQELRDPQDLSVKPVRELNSQPYIDMAKEMAELAPTIRITAVSKWILNESDNYFEWSTPTTTCEVLK